MTSHKSQYTLAELVCGLDVTINGDPDCLIQGVCQIHPSKPGHITFLTNSLYRKHLANTQASAVVLGKDDASACPANVNAVISANPYYDYAQIAAFFDEQPDFEQGIHPTAVVGKDSDIDATASIGANCVVGCHVKIAANVVIEPGCLIGDFVEIGEATHLHPNVTIYHHAKIGRQTQIASGVVIGSDGFGFANHQGAWHKVPQLGSVIIGNHVEIGTNTTIDRGAVEDTIIGNGVKLDNLIQVGHNVKIGENTVIAGCTGIAGSAVVGKNCMIGGASMINGHITICDNAMITGGTGVSKSIREPGIYSSGIVGVVPNHEFRKNNARFHRLENLMQRVKTLEQALKKLTERNES